MWGHLVVQRSFLKAFARIPISSVAPTFYLFIGASESMKSTGGYAPPGSA